MTVEPRVRVATDELPPLREAMRDVQEAVAAYYAATARGENLGSTVRRFLVAAQTVNELLANGVRDTASYAELFATPAPHSGTEVVAAVKYARNVVEHVLHIVQPKPDVLIGGQLGMRVYAYWQDVPPEKHAKLRPGTQKLKPAYDEALRGKEVVGTMLEVLRFYAEVAPEIVHRDDSGEWTGFPLMSQPGVGDPLHPDEPVDLGAAVAWLDSRPPNGDLRVVCGQVTLDGCAYVVGLVFVERLSFTPFVETIDQGNRDIEAGFPYARGDAATHIEDVSERFPQVLQGGVLQSREEISSWAVPIARVEQDQDWFTCFDPETWLRIVRTENPGVLPESVAYGVRRARRLNAFVPPRG